MSHGLNVDAGAREITRQTDKLKMYVELNKEAGIQTGAAKYADRCRV